MLVNYFKIAIAVLKRRKFFTFISLFGISFTLTILMVLTAYIDKILDSKYPDAKRARSLYITHIELKGPQSMNASALSWSFLNHYVRPMKSIEQLAISTSYSSTSTYVNNKKVSINYKYTNASWWTVLDYNFLEGQPYSEQEIANGEHVAVISDDLKRAYFGDQPSVVGKYLEANNESYRVIGVIKSIPDIAYNTYSDLYLPSSLIKSGLASTSYMGNFIGIMLAPSEDGVKKMKEEYADIIRRLPIPSKEYDHIYSKPESYITSYVATGNEKISGVLLTIVGLSLFVFLIMLVPTLNLVNINITRIMERSSEIGVRKAFGASSKTLVGQFLVENIILTLLGGIIGVLLSFIVLQLINHAQLIRNFELTINFTVLGIGLLAAMLFGLISGVYPAWRMSRMDVIHALKA